MNISKNTRYTKKLIALAILFSLLILIAGAAALEKLHIIDFVKTSKDSPAGPTESEKKQQHETEQNAKKDFVESPDPVQNPANTPSSSSIQLSAKQEANGSVTVLSKLFGVSDGTCTLFISNGSTSYTDSAELIYQPDFSSCAGFSVPKDKLGAGQWSIKLTVTGSLSLDKSILLGVE